MQLQTKPTIPGIWIAKVVAGGPAALAMLKPGHVIAKINEADVLYASLDEVVKLMKDCGRRYAVSVIHKSCVHLLSSLRPRHVNDSAPRDPETSFFGGADAISGSLAFDTDADDADPDAPPSVPAPASPNARTNAYLFGAPAPSRANTASGKRPVGPRQRITLTSFDQAEATSAGPVRAGEADGGKWCTVPFFKPANGTFTFGVGLSAMAHGQHVMQVQRGSVADKIGLASGDAISEICTNGSWQAVRDVDRIDIKALFDDAFGHVLLKVRKAPRLTAVGDFLDDEIATPTYIADSASEDWDAGCPANADSSMDKYFAPSVPEDGLFDDGSADLDPTSLILDHLQAKADEVDGMEHGAGERSEDTKEVIQDFQSALEAARLWWLEQEPDNVLLREEEAAMVSKILQDLKVKVDQVRRIALETNNAGAAPGSPGPLQPKNKKGSFEDAIVAVRRWWRSTKLKPAALSSHVGRMMKSTPKPHAEMELGNAAASAAETMETAVAVAADAADKETASKMSKAVGMAVASIMQQLPGTDGSKVGGSGDDLLPATGGNPQTEAAKDAGEGGHAGSQRSAAGAAVIAEAQPTATTAPGAPVDEARGRRPKGQKPKWRKELEASLHVEKSKRQLQLDAKAKADKAKLAKQKHIKQRREKGKQTARLAQQHDFIADAFKEAPPPKAPRTGSAPSSARRAPAKPKNPSTQPFSASSKAKTVTAVPRPKARAATEKVREYSLPLEKTPPVSKTHGDLKEVIRRAQAGKSASIKDVKQALQEWRNGRAPSSPTPANKARSRRSNDSHAVRIASPQPKPEASLKNLPTKQPVSFMMHDASAFW